MSRAISAQRFLGTSQVSDDSRADNLQNKINLFTDEKRHTFISDLAKWCFYNILINDKNVKNGLNLILQSELDGMLDKKFHFIRQVTTTNVISGSRKFYTFVKRCKIITLLLCLLNLL